MMFWYLFFLSYKTKNNTILKSHKWYCSSFVRFHCCLLLAGCLNMVIWVDPVCNNRYFWTIFQVGIIYILKNHRLLMSWSHYRHYWLYTPDFILRKYLSLINLVEDNLWLVQLSYFVHSNILPLLWPYWGYLELLCIDGYCQSYKYQNKFCQ